MSAPTATTSLREIVEMMAEATRGIKQGNREPRAYRSMYDFVSQHGVEYVRIGNRAEYPAGTPRACFGNSAVAALCCDGLRYVEGFAWNAVTVGVPIHHAWNLDEDDRVIDTTWSNGVAYFGVEFPIKLVTAALERGAGSVLDDWTHDFPILRQPWKGDVS